MSGPDPDREVRAAEYVLGTLTQAEADSVARALPTDAALAEAVDAWERWLAPLSTLVDPQAPPPGLWQQIEARIAPQSLPGVRPAASMRDRLLRWWAAGATAVAAGLAAVLLLPDAGPAPVPMATVMVTDRTQTAWAATALPDGSLRIAAIPPAAGAPEQPVPEGRVLQLWALPPGASAPTSLAVLAPGQRSLTLANPAVRPVPGMLIELTLEPPGGSPLPRPSGPVQYIGRLPA